MVQWDLHMLHSIVKIIPQKLNVRIVKAFSCLEKPWPFLLQRFSFLICWSQIFLYSEGFAVFWWRMSTCEANLARGVREQHSVGGKNTNMTFGSFGWLDWWSWVGLVWPAVHETDSRWCKWRNPQCSKPHWRILRHFSPESWPSCCVSCWWTPSEGPHTEETSALVRTNFYKDRNNPNFKNVFTI